MVKTRIIAIAFLVLLSAGTFNRLSNNENIRPMQFISIFVLGVSTAFLINEFVTLVKAKRQ